MQQWDKWYPADVAEQPFNRQAKPASSQHCETDLQGSHRTGWPPEGSIQGSATDINIIVIIFDVPVVQPQPVSCVCQPTAAAHPGGGIMCGCFASSHCLS